MMHPSIFMVFAMVDNPLQEIAHQAGGMMGDVMGSVYLVGLLAFFVITALFYSVGLKGEALMVMMFPVLVFSMWIGGWPKYVRLVIGLGLGIVFFLGLVRLLGRR